MSIAPELATVLFMVRIRSLILGFYARLVFWHAWFHGMLDADIIGKTPCKRQCEVMGGLLPCECLKDHGAPPVS